MNILGMQCQRDRQNFQVVKDLLRKKFKVCVKVKIKKTNEGSDIQAGERGQFQLLRQDWPWILSSSSLPDHAGVGRRRPLSLQLMFPSGSLPRVSTQQIIQRFRGSTGEKTRKHVIPTCHCLISSRSLRSQFIRKNIFFLLMNIVLCIFCRGAFWFMIWDL